MNRLAASSVILTSPRGFCAGVERAIEVVEVCLKRYPHPVYVYHEIVHNKHVVARLQASGAVFVDDIEMVPDHAVLIFSAHGVSPQVRHAAECKGLTTIDATCPLVTKVHREAIQFAGKDFTILLVGHAGHQEVIGTMGEAPERIRLVETIDDVERVVVDDPEKVAVITQTTLSIADTEDIIKAIKRRFPQVTFPPKEDICYATTNRQRAVLDLAQKVDCILVIGSQNSSNSQRLAEVARDCGKPAYLINDVQEIDPAWFVGVASVGITAGASAPENIVQQVVAFFRERGVEEVEEQEVIPETVRFGLPLTLRTTEKSGQVGPNGPAAPRR
ncbi:MAG: 4-hydroxy-3-methylbut-2-enyl diphosphate reductase [Deltaproteobacteria bacterium]|nr:4-hydroxy-3-methylbut-2-enyl diphosphate reductase [Deltaproteobacteria bacterium]